jgi:hypothetical protein
MMVSCQFEQEFKRFQFSQTNTRTVYSIFHTVVNRLNNLEEDLPPRAQNFTFQSLFMYSMISTECDSRWKMEDGLAMVTAPQLSTPQKHAAGMEATV